MNHDFWMREALNQARAGLAMGEVPVGCVIVKADEIVGRGFNRREVDSDPLAHAEILAIRQASNTLDDWRLNECTLYVTLEPCAMCAGALVNSRVQRLVFGARDPKAGYCGTLGNLLQDSRLNHRVEIVEGILAEESGTLLSDFFASLRRKR